MKLDRIDFSILAQLQQNARISNVDLADKVGLSPSACSRRLDQLEANEVIEGYQAVISNKALGQTITSIVQITLDGQSENHLPQGAAIETFRQCSRRFSIPGRGVAAGYSQPGGFFNHPSGFHLYAEGRWRLHD